MLAVKPTMHQMMRKKMTIVKEEQKKNKKKQRIVHRMDQIVIAKEAGLRINYLE
jgi:hypothetical protein